MHEGFFLLLLVLFLSGWATYMHSLDSAEQVADHHRCPVLLSHPSATAGKPYSAAASSGTNFGPNEPKREQQTCLFPADAPADLRYASGSGLDPDITPEAAAYQVARAARERKISEARVQELDSLGE